jgi:hypothetical protein
MSAYRYGDKIEKTERYKLGEVLSRIANHLIFLTATPHRGDQENYRLFLDLLQPGVFATSEMLQESISLNDNDMIIRRVKEQLKNFNGEPLFLPRHVKTVPFNLGMSSPEEKKLYNDVSEYVHTQFNKALAGDKRRSFGFALVILQRRLASSTYALLKSVERRRQRLIELLDNPQENLKTNERIFDLDTIEDLSEEETWKIESIWETIRVSEGREELAREIQTLERLALKAREIIEKEEEIKIRALKDTLESLNKRFPGHKILIFTESRDTLDYLEQRLKSWEYSVNTIHGGMKREDRILAESIFKDKTQVLVATEAAGEGINLQFCHIMINFDIPWNPNRLEQRMGRIHRYGQTREVFVFNLVAVDTREGRVLNRIFEKLIEIKKALGSDKVFDVISEAIPGKNLAQLLVEAAANARNIDEILRDIDVKIDADYIANVKKSLDESLATSFINYPLINEMKNRSLEHRLIPKYTSAFFKKGFTAAGGKIHLRKDGFLSIDSIPFELRQIAEEDTFKKRYRHVSKTYSKTTFDREIGFKNTDVEFISFGHPLFEALLEWVHRKMSSSLKQGAVFSDPDGNMDGNVLFYEGEIKDGKGEIAGKRLFAFYVDRRSNDVIVKNPSFIWDVSENTTKADRVIDVEGLKALVLQRVLPALEGYKSELTNERIRQAQIKEKYGVKSLETLIDKIDGDLIELYDRRDREENVDLVIHNKKEQQRKYTNALTELQQTIEREKILTIGTPIFVGAICVVPGIIIDPERMKRDKKIEMIGMEKAMAHERSQGRVPEDVCLENNGFDIRSTDTQGNQRYIEVKARAGIGEVALTQNEIFRAGDFGEQYFLYVVMNACNEPELRIYQDPANTLLIEEEIERRFVISPDELLRAKQAG